MSDNPDGVPPYFGAPGFADSYWIELLYNQPSSIDAEALIAKLGASYELAVNKVVERNGAVTVGHRGHLVSMEISGKGQKVPALTNILWSDARIDIKEYKAALEQTWDWDFARRALGRCWYKVLIGDLTGSRLPYQDRYQMIKEIAVACADLSHPLVCHWKEAGCLVEPSALAARLAQACNVRTYQIGISGDHLMDTLGLAAIGLPDVELTFSRLSPDAVANFLYTTAAYLFERGDVIADGDTVPGPEGAKWKTAHGVATLPPARTVVRVSITGTYAPTSARPN